MGRRAAETEAERPAVAAPDASASDAASDTSQARVGALGLWVCLEGAVTHMFAGFT